MKKRIIFNEQGSALAMVIIIITMFCTLGLAVMTLGFAHYKVGIVDKKAKLSFYMAESGLEQAYKIMLEEVAEAVKSGSTAVNTAIKEALLTEAKWKNGEGEDPGTSYVLSSSFDGSEYSIVPQMEEIEKALDAGVWKADFQSGYKGYFNMATVGEGEEAEYKLIARLKDVSEYENPNFNEQGGIAPEVTVSNPPVPSVTAFFADTDDSVALQLKSGYKKDGVLQKVHMTFVIQLPEKVPKNYYLYQDVAEINKTSAIWDNALTACTGDIRIINDNINETETNNITLNGNVYAYGSRPADPAEKKDQRKYGGFVLTGMSGEVKNSVVSVAGDLVTGANLQINDVNSSKITISGTAYTDNLAINGSDTHEANLIKVMGALYTLDDLELNGKKSAIEIMGDYFGFSDGSTAVKHDESSGIVINAKDINRVGGSTLTIGGNVFLLGTSYINVTEGPPEMEGLYQTGESLAIKGNYRAYSSYLPDYEYKYYGPMYLVEKKKAETQSLDVLGKAEYFHKIYTDKNPEWLRKDGGNIQLAQNEGSGIYTLGAYISGNEVYKKGEANLGEVETKKKECKDGYDGKVAQFSDLTKYVDQDIIAAKNNQPVINTESEFVFFSNDKNVYLVGPGGGNTIPSGSEGKIINDPTIHGIIVTEKDVYLRGVLDFNGVIIAGGNVYLEDACSKTIKADRDYVFSKVKGWRGDSDPFTPGYPSEGVNAILESEIGLAEPVSIIPYERYITIKEWTKG